MADVLIGFTLPDAHVSTVKLAIEHLAISKGQLAAGATFTNNQARDYINNLLKDEVRDIVFSYKHQTKTTTATQEATTETNSITFT